MSAPILDQRELEFMLYELFDAEGLIHRERYADHSRETFGAAINTAKIVAEKYLVPIRQQVDTRPPEFDGEKVEMIPEIKIACDAIIASGLAAATADYDMGGMQLPPIVASAAGSFLSAAGSTLVGYSSLTTASANLIAAHGTEEQKRRWLEPMRRGRFAGTMAMTEPDAGSGLGDLTTTAVKFDAGSYRLSGNKIFISGGDHELNDNIVHLVLARVQGAPRGVRGISLFIVPKFLLNDDGSLGARNDVVLAGLFHKMGGRAHTSTWLSFGDHGGATAYLVGEENKGLGYMFHMMNEARIMVGTGAAALALTGYQYSLHYARERPQGRLPSCKNPESPPVNIIEHADVRRMLLAQKAYAEGAFALVLLGAQLADDASTARTREQRQNADKLLDLLTPMIKTWPSEYGPKANSLAIQVLGGHGYINEHPVEMFYRDNRLNPIHEGTTGIQSLDLLARKVPMDNGAAFQVLVDEMNGTIAIACEHSETAVYGEELRAAIARLQATTQALLGAMVTEDIDRALSNSVKYLELFGHVVVAWLWLKQGIVASAALAQQPHPGDENFYRGKMQAMRYFFRFELPEIDAWAKLLSDLDSTCYEMQPQWF